MLSIWRPKGQNKTLSLLPPKNNRKTHANRNVKSKVAPTEFNQGDAANVTVEDLHAKSRVVQSPDKGEAIVTCMEVKFSVVLMDAPKGAKNEAYVQPMED